MLRSFTKVNGQSHTYLDDTPLAHRTCVRRKGGRRSGGSERSEGEVQFWPMRVTAARSLRPGDQLRIPTGPHTGLRARITDIREDEASRTITINGEILGDEDGLFEKKAHPNELFDRLAQPGEPPQGGESRLVHADELWKWIGVDMNDPEGSAEKYVLRAFHRIHSEQTDSEAIEVRLQSKQDPRKLRIATFKPNGTISFKGHR